ncbi:MAG: NHL repeat-containing protein, partial [Candidatus Sulfotelmatobacter sp.]
MSRLRLPSLLLIFVTTLVLVTTLPAATDITADRVLGQAVFTLSTANFVDGAGFNFSDGSIGNTTEADGVAVDTSSTPNHLYIVDSLNSRVLGWNNAESFTSGQAADLVIGQPDMFHNTCNGTGSFTLTSASELCWPTGVAVDSNGDLYIADFENSRVVEYNAPYTAYAGLGDTCTATTPCQNQLSANLVFGQPDSMGNPSFTTTGCNVNTGGQNHPSNNEELCSPEGVSVDPTTHDLYVADSFNNRVVVYLDPLAGGGTPGTSGSAGDETADYVFGQGGSFTTVSCNVGGGTPTASNLCTLQDFGTSGGGVGVDADGNVYIADSGNNRVLQFNTPFTGGVTPVSTAFAANGVFGQTTFTSNTVPGSATAKTLAVPIDVKLDSGGNLYVADSENGRVLEFDTPGASSIDPAASAVFGKSNFTNNSCSAISSSCMSEATGVGIDSLGDLFAADLPRNRVLKFSAPLMATGNSASAVLGQAFFDTSTYNLVDGKGFNLPVQVTVDQYST